MAGRKKKTIALCISGCEPQYQYVIIDSICTRCKELGYNVAVFYSIVGNLNHTPDEAGEVDIFNLPNYELFDGLVVLGRQISPDVLARITDKAKAYGIPIVTISRDVKDCYSVAFEYGDCIRTMIRHFYAKHNFTHIGYMGGGANDPVSAARKQNYLDAMAEFGLICYDSLIGNCEYADEFAIDTIEEFMKSPVKPQAIVCVNDSIAINVCEALLKLGYSVPHDVCVSGFDGIEEAHDASPKITTASADAYLAAVMSVDIIDDVLHRKPHPHKTLLPLNYEFTESCGCVPLDTSHNHTTIHKLYTKIIASSDFSKSILRLNEKMTNLITREEAIDKIAESVGKCWSRRAWLCIREDYFVDSTPEIYDDFKSCRSGYTETMNVLASVNDKVTSKGGSFPIKSLVPDYEENINFCESIFFVPLHSLGQTIGYFAFDYSAPKITILKDRNFEMLYDWMTSISVILENLRIQTELSNYAQRINSLYITDPLTELFNRRGFYQLIRKNLPTHEQFGNEIAIISSDLDNLKEINDIYGHTEGDFAISSAAKAIRKGAGEMAVCARFGGDEFVAFIPKCGDNDAVKVIDRISQALDEINNISGKPYSIGISSGHAVTAIDIDFSIDALISKADASMYSAKKARKKIRLR